MNFVVLMMVVVDDLLDVEYHSKMWSVAEIDDTAYRYYFYLRFGTAFSCVRELEAMEM